MNRGEIYLTVDDLMRLMGTQSRNSAYNKHRSIREALTPEAMREAGRCKPSLTIREYCRFVGEDFDDLFGWLRA